MLAWLDYANVLTRLGIGMCVVLVSVFLLISVLFFHLVPVFALTFTLVLVMLFLVAVAMSVVVLALGPDRDFERRRRPFGRGGTGGVSSSKRRSEVGVAHSFAGNVSTEFPELSTKSYSQVKSKRRGGEKGESRKQEVRSTK